MAPLFFTSPSAPPETWATRIVAMVVDPDASLMGDPWHPDPRRSAVVLRNQSHRFTVKIPGLALTRVTLHDVKLKREMELNDNSVEVSPGVYDLRW